MRKVMGRLGTLALAALVLAGCATGMPRASAAHPTKPPAEQATDRAYCTEQARQFAGDPNAAAVESGVRGGLLGAAGGAGAGAIIGGIRGGVGSGAGYGAAAGALLGIIAGAAQAASAADERFNRQFEACMAASGYFVR